ncbi:hypothetical protein V1477_012799 [Vespula maculifrons]|uniref:Uncharacterized protein n=1 Tax=Vespula maculifrons TaxID=7453 RepID=A0ABD2BUB4_VESMC
MSEQGHPVRNGILLGITLRPSASDAHIPPLSTTVRAFRISNNKTRSTVGPLIAPEHPQYMEDVRLNLEFDRENLGKILKNAAIRSVILAVHEFPMYHKYFRPRSHRVEVAAVGDPRTNESKATGRPPLPTNSSLQTLKLQPHASPHLGTDLRIAQLSNIGSFDHHWSTTGCAFATNAGIQN